MSAEVSQIARASEPELPIFRVDEDDASSSYSHSEEGDVADAPDSEPGHGKDSGVDCGGTDATSFELPDEATALKIRQTVEYYFSDQNILKDPFLLKHVRRNKEGYVSLKLISSFRKVRSLSRCWKAVAHSLQMSQLLVLNSDGTKIRRLAPLPDYDETLPNRMVIVYGFADNQKPSVESVSEMFSKCGEIALVRVLRPGSSVPPEVKRFLSKSPDMQNKMCALIEFEDHAGAKKALGSDSTKENCQPGLRILPVVLGKEKEKLEQTNIKDIPKPDPSSLKESPKKKKKTRKNQNKNSKKHVNTDDDQDNRKRRSSSGSLGYWSSGSSSGYLSSSPNNDSRFPRRHSHQGVTVSSIYLDAPPSFASLNNRNFNGSRDRLNRDRDGGKNSAPLAATPGSQSPWRRRREQLQLQSLSASGEGNDSNSSICLRVPVQALRQPRGPDGTKGFHGHRLTIDVSRGIHRPTLPSTVE